MRKPVFRVSDQVRHKPSYCTATEDGYRLEISYLGSRWKITTINLITYPCSEYEGADTASREADLRLCSRICKKPVFSLRGSFYVHVRVIHHHHHHIHFRARFPLPRVGLFDKSSSKTSSPLRAILRVSRVHI